MGVTFMRLGPLEGLDWMEAWDVVVVGAGPAALRAAIACSDGGLSPLMIDGSGIGSASGANPISGIAASIGELDSTSHRDDTVAAGGDEADQASASRVCNESVSTLAELEQWGLVVRRSSDGLPHSSKLPGHSVARVSGCGDSTMMEVTRILEEQVIKRGVKRISDLLPMQIVMDNGQVRGIVTLDILSGEIKAIQTKAIILATEGYQGLWTDPNEGDGIGCALALSVGVKLAGMDFVPKHTLTIRGCGVHIPLDVLGSGGRIRNENGEDVEPEDVIEGEPCVLDLRGLSADSLVWFARSSSRVKDRTGLDISREVVPIAAGFAVTTGGAPCNENGRVTFDGSSDGNGKGKMWYTGLYAAGRSSNSGMHGSGLLPGNILLEDLVTGRAAGSDAAVWAREVDFGGSDHIDQCISASLERIVALKSPEGFSIGEVISKLSKLMGSHCDSRDDSGESSTIGGIKELRDRGIALTDPSSGMNTELVSAIKIEGLLGIAEAIAASGD